MNSFKKIFVSVILLVTTMTVTSSDKVDEEMLTTLIPSMTVTNPDTVYEEMLASGEITIDLKSFVTILQQQPEFYLGTPEEHARTIRFFQKNGLDINKLYSYSDIQLSQEQYELFEQLSESDKKKTFTPLMLFCNYGPIVTALLECGANPYIKDREGLTALDHLVTSWVKSATNRNNGGSYIFALQSLTTLLQAVDQKHRNEFFQHYLPVNTLPTWNKQTLINFVDADEKEDLHLDFPALFVYTFPLLSSDYVILLQFYIDNLQTTNDRKLFHTKMQGFLNFIEEQINEYKLNHSCSEDSPDNEENQASLKEIITITQMINDLA